MLALPSFANDDTEKPEFRHFKTITERLVARPLPGVNGKNHFLSMCFAGPLKPARSYDA
jgi:hypothetical protein